MPAIEFEAWCGICGRGCCGSTDVKGNQVTITCPDCEDKIADLDQSLQDADDKIHDLESEIRDLLLEIGSLENRLKEE